MRVWRGGQVEKSISPLAALPHPNRFFFLFVCIPEATKHRECDMAISLVHVYVTNTQQSLRTAPSTLCHTHQNTQKPGSPGPQQQNENNPEMIIICSCSLVAAEPTPGPYGMCPTEPLESIRWEKNVRTG